MDTDEQNQTIQIGSADFRLKSYYRGVTDDMISRFGSSEQGESNLDLAKVETQKSFRGGMFQKHFVDPEMTEYIKNAHYNSLDGKLYFTPEMDRVENSGQMNQDGVTAWCIANGYVYFAYRVAPPSTGNRVTRMKIADGTFSSITLPTAIQNSTTPITSMVFGKNFIFYAGKSAELGGASFIIHRMNVTTNAFTSLVAAAANARKIVFFRDKLYGMGLYGFFIITSETSGTAKCTGIKSPGVTEPELENVHDLIPYNGALYIAKTDGLFRYDGVDVNAVFDYSNSIEQENFQYNAVFNGRYYFTMADKQLWQFDGINIEMIQDLSDAYVIQGLSTSADRLWIDVVYNKTSPSIYSSPNFTDPMELQSKTYALITFNGIGFFEYQSFLYLGTGAEEAFDVPIKPQMIAAGAKFYWIMPNLYYNASLEIRSAGIYVFSSLRADDYTSVKLPQYRSFEVFSSEVDDEYPSVDKVLLGVQADYQGFIEGESYLSLEVSVKIDDSYGDYVEIWNSKYADNMPEGNDYYLHEQYVSDLLTEPIIYKNLKYKLVGYIETDAVLTDIPRVESITLRYAIQPKFRLQWGLSLGIYAEGEDPQEATTKRKVIYDAYRDKKPVLLYDVDYTEIVSVEGSVDAASIVVQGYDFLRDGDTIGIEVSEGVYLNRQITNVSYDTVNKQTSFDLTPFGARRGIGGSADAALSAEMTVRKSHAVMITKIHTERYVLQEDSINDTVGASNIESDLQVDAVEV